MKTFWSNGTKGMGLENRKVIFVTKSGTGTWDWDVGLGLGDVGRGDSGT